MEVIPKKVCTGVTSVTVKDSEETTFGPIFNVLLVLRLHNIEDYTDSVFIVISNNALVSVGSVAHNDSVLSYTAFCWFPAG